MLEQLGILARSGIHCAPRAHKTLGTLGGPENAQGAFRMSIGPFVTPDDVRHACAALIDVCREVAAVGQGKR